MKVELTTLDKIKKALNIEIEMATVTVDNGAATLEAEVFEAGQPVFIVNEDERIALPVGEYLLDDGMVLVVAEEGIIAEVKEQATEEEAVEEEEVAMDDKPNETPLPKSVIESVVKETKFSADDVEALRNEITELKAQVAELSKEEVKEEVELTEEVKPITHNPENVVEKQGIKYGSAKHDTPLSRAFARLSK
jgi:hypothetical protein